MNPTAWSPSRIFLYESCPQKFDYQVNQKLCPTCYKGKMKGFDPSRCDTCGKVEEKGAALVKGSEVDKSIEDYIKGLNTGLDRRISDTLRGTLDSLRDEYTRRKVRVQVEIAVNREWKMVDYFDKSVYARFKLDALKIYDDGRLLVIDWKSGRYRPDDPQYISQLHAYRVAALSMGLGDKVKSKLVFTDTGQEVPKDPEVMTLAELPMAQKAWDKRALPIFTDTVWTPTPGDVCKYCHYTRNRGGPCKF